MRHFSELVLPTFPPYLSRLGSNKSPPLRQREGQHILGWDQSSTTTSIRRLFYVPEFGTLTLFPLAWKVMNACSAVIGERDQ